MLENETANEINIRQNGSTSSFRTDSDMRDFDMTENSSQTKNQFKNLEINDPRMGKLESQNQEAVGKWVGEGLVQDFKKYAKNKPIIEPEDLDAEDSEHMRVEEYDHMSQSDREMQPGNFEALAQFAQQQKQD